MIHKEDETNIVLKVAHRHGYSQKYESIVIISFQDPLTRKEVKYIKEEKKFKRIIGATNKDVEELNKDLKKEMEINEQQEGAIQKRGLYK